MHFTVVIPNHDQHLQCFREVALSVDWALRELGHETSDQTTGLRALTPGTREIYFGLPQGPLPPAAIVYNGEQVSTGSLWSIRNLPRVYRNHAVWDYSPVNAKRYAAHGLPEPATVRPGYCPLIENTFPKVPKIYDVAFFGSSNPRREKILTEITEQGLSLLRVPFGIYGAERDAVLAQAHLCANIHFYESAIFESVRCSYLIHNGMAVLSEDDDERSCERWGVAHTTPENFAAYAKDLMCRESALGGLRLLQKYALEKISIKDDVGAALERLGAHDAARAQVSVPAGAPQVTLSMIVKNEADVIARCLASVKPHLSHWCIVDTGSTDGTQDIIREAMQGIPGTLHELPWKEFDGSRNEAMDLARKECGDQGWILLIDSDEIFECETLTPDESYDCYNVWVTRCEGCATWGRPALVHANKPWFYEMPRHEGLYCRMEARTAPEQLSGVRITSFTDGGRAKEDAYDRFMRDARILEQWILSHPGHTRAQYYIAQSYRDAATGRHPVDKTAAQRAVMAYLKRADMKNGFDQETFSAMVQAARCMEHCGYPFDRIQNTLLRAFDYRPTRAEPLTMLATYYRTQGHYPLAEMFARRAALAPPSTDMFPDVDHETYTWKAKEELAVCLTYLNGHEEALKLNLEIIDRAPPHERQRIQDNIDMCRRTLRVGE